MPEIKMGNTIPGAGLEPTSMAFGASVLPLHHVGSLTSLLYPPRPPLSAAPCLKGQCRLLQYLQQQLKLKSNTFRHRTGQN